MAINKALITAFYDAANFLDDVRSTYRQAKQARAKLTLYQAGTDAELLAAVNVVFTPQQRAEIAQIAGLLATFATDMETNHATIVVLL